MFLSSAHIWGGGKEAIRLQGEGWSQGWKG